LGTRAPVTHSVSRSFFDRGVGSSILASLSEAGGNDRHLSLSKPLPPRSRTCDSRLSECARVFLWMHAAGQVLRAVRSKTSLILLVFRLRLMDVSIRGAASNPIREESLPGRESRLSFQGMFVNTSTHLTERAVVIPRFRLTWSDVQVQTRCEVRYCLLGVGIGVEFIGLGIEAVRAIEEELRYFSRFRRPAKKQPTR
jgi:hypothetical protein